MGLDFSLNEPSNDSPASIFKEDVERFESIKQKLCKKRGLLEAGMQSPDQVTREQSALDLIQLKESMSIIGISEIDYQAYLVKEASQDQVLPIF